MYVANPTLDDPFLEQPPVASYKPPITKGGQFIREGEAHNVLTILMGPSPYQGFIRPILSAQQSRLPKKFLRIVSSEKEVPKRLQRRFVARNNTLVGGTIDRAAGMIYMCAPPKRTIDTRLEFALHEAVHLVAHPFMSVIDDATFRRTYRRSCGADDTVGTFQRVFCTGLGEGMTQLITEQIMESQGISKTASERPYKDCTPLARELVRIFSLDTCARAYFCGEVNELIGRMELRWGPTWQNVANFSYTDPKKALEEIQSLERNRIRDYPTPAQLKRSASLANMNNGRSLLGAFGLTKTSQGRPPFRFDCAGTAPLNAQSLQRIFYNRIRGAIALARNGATGLETPAGTSHIASTFRSIFGEGPTTLWEVPGRPSSKMAAGEVVASRLRNVATELESRDTLYRCVSGSSCAQGRSPLIPTGAEEVTTRHPTETDVVDHVAVARICRNEVWLCPGFWALRPEWQAATLIHEMLHLCFGLTCAWFQHDSKERKRNSAYCYEAFALTASRQVPEQITVQQCRSTPI